ncbi:uncharacterized protein LOC144348159 [Saccoglossus kowalevskii]
MTSRSVQLRTIPSSWKKRDIEQITKGLVNANFDVFMHAHRNECLVVFETNKVAKEYYKNVAKEHGIFPQMCNEVFQSYFRAYCEPWVTCLTNVVNVRLGITVNKDRNGTLVLEGSEKDIRRVKKYIEDSAPKYLFGDIAERSSIESIVHVTGVPIDTSSHTFMSHVRQESSHVLEVKTTRNTERLILFDTEKYARRFSEKQFVLSLPRHVETNQCRRVFAEVTAKASPWLTNASAAIDSISKKCDVRVLSSEPLELSGDFDSLMELKAGIRRRFIDDDQGAQTQVDHFLDLASATTTYNSDVISPSLKGSKSPPSSDYPEEAERQFLELFEAFNRKTGIHTRLDPSSDALYMSGNATTERKNTRKEKITNSDSMNDVPSTNTLGSAKGTQGKSQQRLEKRYEFRTSEGIKVTVKHGDITKESVDVIVNASNNALEHDTGVARALVKAGGREIQHESLKWVAKYGYINVTDHAVTKAGSLYCRYILHVNGPVWETHISRSGDLLYHTILSALKEANRMRMQSIAIPAVSSGISGMPIEICAHAMYRAVMDFSLICLNYKYMRNVYFVNIDEKTTDVFMSTFIAENEGDTQSNFHQERTDINAACASLEREDNPTSAVASNASYFQEAQLANSEMSPQPSVILPKELLSKMHSKKKGTCDICTDEDILIRMLTCCKYPLCDQCAMKHFSANAKCPSCQNVLFQYVGDQPAGGAMTWARETSSLPGYEKYGTIVIYYDIPDGFQELNHPNPGKMYSGTRRRAFLPDNSEGRNVLDLLKKAFDQRLVFTVGNSHTTGTTDTVVWNDVHHKTSRTGGPTSYGYPDPTYLKRVKEELASKGIK